MNGQLPRAPMQQQQQQQRPPMGGMGFEPRFNPASTLNFNPNGTMFIENLHPIPGVPVGYLDAWLISRSSSNDKSNKHPWRAAYPSKLMKPQEELVGLCKEDAGKGSTVQKFLSGDGITGIRRTYIHQIWWARNAIEQDDRISWEIASIKENFRRHTSVGLATFLSGPKIEVLSMRIMLRKVPRHEAPRPQDLANPRFPPQFPPMNGQMRGPPNDMSPPASPMPQQRPVPQRPMSPIIDVPRGESPPRFGGPGSPPFRGGIGPGPAGNGPGMLPLNRGGGGPGPRPMPMPRPASPAMQGIPSSPQFRNVRMNGGGGGRQMPEIVHLGGGGKQKGKKQPSAYEDSDEDPMPIGRGSPVRRNLPKIIPPIKTNWREGSMISSISDFNDSDSDDSLRMSSATSPSIDSRFDFGKPQKKQGHGGVHRRRSSRDAFDFGKHEPRSPRHQKRRDSFDSNHDDYVMVTTKNKRHSKNKHGSGHRRRARSADSGRSSRNSSPASRDSRGEGRLLRAKDELDRLRDLRIKEDLEIEREMEYRRRRAKEEDHQHQLNLEYRRGKIEGLEEARYRGQDRYPDRYAPRELLDRALPEPRDYYGRRRDYL